MTRRAAARRRRPQGGVWRLDRRAGRADHSGLRPLRRAAARPARAVGHARRSSRRSATAASSRAARRTTNRRSGSRSPPSRPGSRPTGGLPVNVKVLLEGEEEIGSRTLPAILERYRDLLAADVLVSADGGRWRPGAPERQRQQPRQSRHGGARPHRRARPAFRPLRRPGRQRRDGARPPARDAARRAQPHRGRRLPRRAAPPGNADIAGMEALGFDEAAFFAEIGARPGAIEPGVRLLESLWLRPTIEVNGMSGGYTGPGGKTVIPVRGAAPSSPAASAPARTRRTSPTRVGGASARALPAWADLEIDRRARRHAGLRRPGGRPLPRRGRARDRARPRRKPVRVGIGGTLPISPMVKQASGAGDGDAVLRHRRRRTSTRRTSSSGCHSFDEGLMAWARALPELAKVKRA